MCSPAVSVSGEPMPGTYVLSGISLPLDSTEEDAFAYARRRLRAAALLPDDAVFALHRRSVDARKRSDIRLVYAVAVTGSFAPDAAAHADLLTPLRSERPVPVFGTAPLSAPPVVVGAGPCGLFAALILAENGYAPVLLERGGTVRERVQAFDRLRRERILDPETNIQFGAGGAGTFSDGKLVTRIHDPVCGYVLEQFAACGAPADILTRQKPHIGTDLLRTVVTALQARIEACGGRVFHHTRMDRILHRDGRVHAVLTPDGPIDAGALILAVGHSARDTYGMLMDLDIALEAKPFSVGVRIEHLQSDIDRALFGSFAGHPALGHGEYNLSYNTKERGVYSFCMCPGGTVIAAASEEGGVVVNGMSSHARDGRNANCALAVSIFREDYGATPARAIAFQRGIEQAAFAAGGGAYSAPICLVGDFLSGTCGTQPRRILPSYFDGEGVRLCSPDAYLPPFVTQALRGGIAAFEGRIEGFSVSDAVLTGAETRTSAPIRILRGEDRCAIGFSNLYPAGEGAGYAGGITSAAVDGIRTALALMAAYAPPG